MSFTSCFTKHSDVKIHYIDSIAQADNKLMPVLICPGLSETAEEYEDFLQYLLPRRAIVLSFRGRGQSDTPLTGYDLDDHIGDIEAVIESAGLTKFHLFGYSRGVSYALGYARKHQVKVASIIVEDYPNQHKQMPTNWDEEYIHDYLIPYSRTKNIREQAVRGIQKESHQEQLVFYFDRPALIVYGSLEGSLICDDDLKLYTDQFSNATIVACQNSSHDIRNTEKNKLYREINLFISSI